MRALGVIASALLCLQSVSAAAQSLPKLTQPVNDLAQVMDAASVAELDKRIRALQAASGDVVVVATVPSMAPYSSIEDYAAKLFETATIGDRGKDNGLLIVAAIQDRAVRVEVGYALEEIITDGYAGETIRAEMLPPFRRGEYGPGLLAGATRIITHIADRRGVTLTDVPRPPEPEAPRPPGTVIVLAIIAFLIISNIARRGGGGPGFRGRRRGTWSGWHGGVGGFGGGFGGFGGGFGGFGGGGGGGGFGGFGGGRSGGGGASGGW